MKHHQTHQHRRTHRASSHKTLCSLSSKPYFAGWSCLGLLSFIIFITFSPISFSPSSALQNTTQSLDTTATVKATASLAVSLTPTVEINSMPTPSGKFNTGEATLNVSTNNLKGYSVYINTKDQTTAMTRDNATTVEESVHKVEALASPAPASGFAANTWGYSLAATIADESTIYQPISSLDQPMLAGGGATQTNGDTYHLTFGAKIDQALPAGQYTNHVAVSVIANPLEITTLSELVYMQDMTPEICQNTGEITPGNEVEKQLVDVRDGKKYWVAKLADQNCWMTQNLALDLKDNATLPLTPSTSDVHAEWRPESNTATSFPETAASYSGTGSWNLGDYVFATPKKAACTETMTDYAQCSHFQEVSSWQPDFVAQNGGWNDYTGYVAADQSTQTYDAHYLVGNFYQFYTATAQSSAPSSDISSTTGFSDAPDSVCPKGWKLPTGSSYQYPNTANRASFYNLALAYGYPEISQWREASGWALRTPLKQGTNYIIDAPMHFPIIGMINMSTMQLHSPSGWGYAWTSTSNDNNWIVPSISMEQTSIYIADVRTENGLPVRCLAR